MIAVVKMVMMMTIVMVERLTKGRLKKTGKEKETKEMMLMVDAMVARGSPSQTPILEVRNGICIGRGSQDITLFGAEAAVLITKLKIATFQLYWTKFTNPSSFAKVGNKEIIPSFCMAFANHPLGFLPHIFLERFIYTKIDAE